MVLETAQGSAAKLVCDNKVELNSTLVWTPFCIYSIRFLIDSIIMCFNSKLNFQMNIKVGLIVLFSCHIYFVIDK